MNHIESAKDIIQKALSIASRPVIMFSGGKDSMAMTHLMKFGMGLNMDAIFHKEPFMAEKYAFGESVLRAWRIPAHDYPPLFVSLWQSEDAKVLAYTNHYQIGSNAEGKPVPLDLPKNVMEPEDGKPWLCGVDSILKRPTGYYNYPFDMAFVGHKSCDEDQIAGKVPLHVDIKQNLCAPSLSFPLRHWSHEQVWDYIYAHNIPVQTDRYDALTHEELPDKTFNSDYFHACIRCMDKREGPSVHCPKLNLQISNISDEVPYRNLKLDYFGD